MVVGLQCCRAGVGRGAPIDGHDQAMGMCEEALLEAGIPAIGLGSHPYRRAKIHSDGYSLDSPDESRKAVARALQLMIRLASSGQHPRGWYSSEEDAGRLFP